MAPSKSHKYDEILEYLRINPGSTRKDIADGLGEAISNICGFIYRMMDRDEVTVCGIRREECPGRPGGFVRVQTLSVTGHQADTIEEFVASVAQAKVFQAGEKTYIEGQYKERAERVMAEYCRG